MPIETKAGATVITGANSINVYRLLTLKHGLKLEILGMTRRGRSIYQIVKQEFGFRGSKKAVLAQLESYITAQYPDARSAQ